MLPKKDLTRVSYRVTYRRVDYYIYIQIISYRV